MRRALAMPVPGVLPPTRPRRARRPSSSTPKHPGTRAILATTWNNLKSLVDRKLLSNGSPGPTPNGTPVKHTVLSHSFFLFLIYNPSLKLLVSSLSIVHCALHFASLFFHLDQLTPDAPAKISRDPTDLATPFFGRSALPKWTDPLFFCRSQHGVPYHPGLLGVR